MERKFKMNLKQMLDIFELNQTEIPNLNPGPVETVQKNLEEFKSICEKKYRRLMMQNHPDRNPTKQAKEKAIQLNNAIEQVRNLKIIRPKPVQIRVVSSCYYYGYGSCGGTTYANTSTAAW